MSTSTIISKFVKFAVWIETKVRFSAEPEFLKNNKKIKIKIIYIYKILFIYIYI